MIFAAHHDAPGCSDCRDTGYRADPRSADEDNRPDWLACSCGSYDAWKCTEPAPEHPDTLDPHEHCERVIEELEAEIAHRDRRIEELEHELAAYREPYRT